MNWRDVRKIDAHIHILPDEKLDEILKEDLDNIMRFAKAETYISCMDKYNISKAILVPASSPHMYYFEPEKTNAFHADLVRKYPDRFIAFADVPKTAFDLMESGAESLQNAVVNYGMKGVKIHPSNLHIPMDSLDYVPLLRRAADLNIPVMIHSNPTFSGFADDCAPDRINRMIKIFPDLIFITSHMGGVKWQDAMWNGYVDISGTLPFFIKEYGVEQTERILKGFGANRLIFATDFPDAWFVHGPNIFEIYFDILDQMHFNDEEIEKIAHGNIEKILKIQN